MHRLHRLSALLLTLTLLLGLPGCNEEKIIATSYKTLATASAAYDAALETAADLDRRDKLSPAHKVQVIVIGNQFRDAYKGACLALEAYAVTARAEDKTKLVTALVEVTGLLGELSNLLNPYLTDANPGGAAS